LRYVNGGAERAIDNRRVAELVLAGYSLLPAR
jgi:hypothetical protein